ncbi:hypothetical protein CB0940_00196 [Cercospora beticola]|uniref:Uncharacterized protein n=1 Tax=Cercospora beticola TaxID=122368 RepID=A0A2G5ICW5_CERBT|nr:hypothetical protein CB0940_00196 [Cercospora beticola]PIB02619.1 hypothetical protein CB0940_00196 [Cercospora beticola]WPA95599.1 hypothetical protein RHO25_000201 [Cercospora beticola]
MEVKKRTRVKKGRPRPASPPATSTPAPMSLALEFHALPIPTMNQGAAHKGESALDTAAEPLATEEDQTAGPGDKAPEKLFEFLELPPELRNAIYALVVEDHPIVIAQNHRRRVKITCGLIRVNKMIHDEIRSYATLEAPVIRAQVIDFCFGHVITYLNRLGETQLKQLEHGTDVQRSTTQTIKIKLVFTTSGPNCQELDRWLNRFDVSAKRAANVRFEYEATEFKGDFLEINASRTDVDFCLDWRFMYSPTRSREKAMKIESAFNRLGETMHT